MEKNWISVITALALAAVSAIPATAEPDRTPHTIRNDFETGEMHGWEAYPYAQDIGYEPFTTCFREPAHNGSRFSLGNIRRAWDIVELSQGFTREVDIYTTADSRFRAAVFLTAERKPAVLELSLGLFDGSRYFHVIPGPEVNRWLELDIPAGNFTRNGKPISTGDHVQAVTIRVEYPSVYHLASYTISLDDFELSGERQRRFVALSPASTDFDMFGFSVLNRHFFSGDAFGLTVRPEEAPGKYSLAAVTLSLLDPAGKTVASGIPLTALDGNAWRAENAYTFKPSDPRGQWTAELTGHDDYGTEVRWGFRFLMPGGRLTPKDHPRVFFTAEELRERLDSQSDAERKMLEGIVPEADEFRDRDLSGISEPSDLSSEALTGHAFSKPRGDRWSGPMNTLARVAEEGALRYAFTGDETAGQKAREALLRLCAFRMWNHPWQEARGNHTYYPVGYVIGPVGIAYDLLYPLLSEADRDAVRDALMEKGVKQFYRDMVEMNRMPSSVSNHITVIVSNLAIAATALYGEDPGNPAFEPYFSGILAKMKRFIDRTYYPDGGYGEPKGYENMATRDLVEALFVLEKNFGIDYTTTTNLRELWRYPLHAAYSDSRMPDYGDTGVFGGWGWTGNPFLWLSWRTKNPYTAFFTQPDMDSGRGSLFKWLCYTKGLETKSREEFVPSRHFPEKGHMVMRSCWSDGGSIMVFKCGPNSNHYHLDQGSPILVTNGEVLLSEASLETFKGYHAYYANPFYPFYTTQAMGHNVMLVDGDPESQTPADYRNGIAALRNWPSITRAFAGWRVDDVEGDLTCVYKGKLTRYTRSFLYLKPDVIFMYDTVNSPGEHSYDWLFHAEDVNGKPSISVQGKRVLIERPKARLVMDVLSPEVTGRVRVAERDESFVQLTSTKALREAEFLAVLAPSAKPDPATPEKQLASTLLNPEGWTGARVETGSGIVRALFRTGTSGRTTVEGFTTDAGRFAVETGPDGTVRTLFIRGTEFEGGGVSLRSGVPLTASLSFGQDGTNLEADTGRSGQVSIRLAKAPVSVTINDAPTKNFRYDRKSGELRLVLPEGRSLVKVR